MKKKLLISSIMLLISSISHAYILAQKLPAGQQVFSADKETHVIMVSKDLGFFLVGVEQYKTISKNHPNDQYVFITTQPTSSRLKQNQLAQNGFTMLVDDSKTLSEKVFLSLLGDSKISSNKIKSLTLIGHNGAHAGPWLQDGMNRLNFRSPELAKLKSKFTPDAYLSLMGCNSGWNVAPAMSKLLGIPALATFTSSGVYILTKNQEYELYSEATIQNKETRGCGGAECLNLRPEGAPYHFHMHSDPRAVWLPISKMVCDASISTETCQRAYANVLLNTISSTNKGNAKADLKEFENIFADQVCGAISTARGQQSCREQALQNLRAGTGFFPIDRGTPLNCLALRSCQIQEISNDLRLNSPQVPKNEIKIIQDMYRHAMAGWKLIQATQ